MPAASLLLRTNPHTVNPVPTLSLVELAVTLNYKGPCIRWGPGLYTTLTLSGLTCLRSLSFVVCAALKKLQTNWFSVTVFFQ